jgi:hypothetical protein
LLKPPDRSGSREKETTMPETAQAALIWRAEHPTTTDAGGVQAIARLAATVMGLVRRAPLSRRHTVVPQPTVQIQAGH